MGNCFQATGGTNITLGVYEIIAWTATTWTVTGAANLTGAGGAGAAITGKMGGCFASPGKAAGLMTAGNTTWIAAGTYNCTATANIAGGRVSMPAGVSNSQPSRLYGYNAARLDWGTKPILQSNANTQTLVTTQAADEIDNIECKLGNSNTAIQGFIGGGGTATFRRCKATNCDNGGFGNGASTGKTYYLFCEASGLTGGSTKSGFDISNGTGWYDSCVVDSCATLGFSCSSFSTLHNCIATTISGTACHAFQVAGSAVGEFSNCVAYSIANGNGFNNAGQARWANCVAEAAAGASGGFGFGGTAALRPQIINCAGFNNVTNVDVATLPEVTGFKTLNSTPFTSASGNDFSLNNTASAGASLRAAAYPSSYPGLSTNTYQDIGAAQHADPATQGGCRILESSIIQGLGRIS